MRRQYVLGTVLATCLAVALTACTAPPPVDADAPAPTHGTTDVISPTPTTTSDAGSVGDSGPCDAAVPALPVADGTEIEQLGGVTLAVPADRGPMLNAAGEAVFDDEGVPVAYRVAAGDVLSAVSARFCVEEVWLHWVNAVRRDGDALYAGDTLNLDAHTIFSIGDQNGVVHDNPLPEGFAIPPQR